jgi:phospholipase/carboxylesterase
MTELDGPRWGPASRGIARQLIVLCHGVGADGHDLIDLAPFLGRSLPNAAFIAPHAPFPYDSVPEVAGLSGRQWFSIADRTPSVLEAGVRTAAPFLDRLIDAELARLGLPANAYALVGFSQGAMTALFVGLRRPAAPRAIVAFSGALLAPAALAAERRNSAPILLVHGESDDVVPSIRSQEAEQVLRAAGVRVESLFMPGLGHGIDEGGIAAAAEFLKGAFNDPTR